MTKIKYSTFKSNTSIINPNIPPNHNNSEIQNKYKNYYKELSISDSQDKNKNKNKNIKSNIELFTNYNSKSITKKKITNKNSNIIKDINIKKKTITEKFGNVNKNEPQKENKKENKKENEEENEEETQIDMLDKKNKKKEDINNINENKKTFINKIISFLITIFFLTILSIIVYFLYMYFFKKINIFSKYELTKNNFIRSGGASEILKITDPIIINSNNSLNNSNIFTKDLESISPLTSIQKIEISDIKNDKIINDILQVLKKFEN